MERHLADDPKALATSMIATYGAQAEYEARKYALEYKEKGQTQAYAIWIEAAEIIARRQKLIKNLDG